MLNCDEVGRWNISWAAFFKGSLRGGPYINERWSKFVLSLVVLAGILSVAVTDKAVGPSVSVASLYFLPLALSALVHPLRVGIALSIICLLMHHIVEAPSDFGSLHVSCELITLAAYVFVVIIVNQLGSFSFAGFERRNPESN